MSKTVDKKYPLTGDRVAKVSISNTSNGVIATVSVHKLEGNFETHVIFEDYFKRTLLGPKVSRVTAKVLQTWEQMLDGVIESHKPDIEAHYA